MLRVSAFEISYKTRYINSLLLLYYYNGALPTNDCWRQKTRVPVLSHGVVCVILCLAILV